MSYEFAPARLDELVSLLSAHGAQEALIKPLRKNHNDKNQIYSAAGFDPVYPMFDVTFSLRGASTSRKKGSRTMGKFIPEAVFRKFSWIDSTGREIPAREAKMIIYAQYPETRLSGFQTVENTMPETLSVDFTKQHPDIARYLVLGRRGAGEVIAVMVADPGQRFRGEVASLPNATGSRVWKHLRVGRNVSAALERMLCEVANRPVPGCRLDANRKSLPFNGTQVCGYTLEHELGIVPNSDKNGDFEGIELKAHTQNKVTLFTPEPDMGFYAEDFAKFMLTYGYEAKPGEFRLTGIHRVGVRCEKSALTLKIVNHERGASIAAAADKDVHVGLYDDQGRLAAGWSLERLLNCWSAKHNESVYVRASKARCEDPELLAAGHKYMVEFSDRVMWCHETSAEQLFEALYAGTLFLDPAPKYCPENASLNKRRSQWRVNNISEAANDLYTDVRMVSLRDSAAA